MPVRIPDARSSASSCKITREITCEITCKIACEVEPEIMQDGMQDQIQDQMRVYREVTMLSWTDARKHKKSPRLVQLPRHNERPFNH